MPGDEMCNGNDDDCDGQVDEDAQADCVAPGTGCAGVRSCEQGRSVCAATVDPLPEVCNGASTTTVTARPTKTPTRRAPTTTSAAARTAQVSSAARVFARRAFAIAKPASSTPRAAGKPNRTRRACGAQDGVADRRGLRRSFDETCPCTGSGSRPCHNGPDTPTRRRVQTRNTDVQRRWWGPCEGEVTPQPEACPTDDADNDCNGKVDDVLGLGVDCISDGLGRCHNGKQQCVGATLKCVTPSASDEVCNGLDDDCNGKTDEPFAAADRREQLRPLRHELHERRARAAAACASTPRPATATAACATTSAAVASHVAARTASTSRATRPTAARAATRAAMASVLPRRLHQYPEQRKNCGTCGKQCLLGLVCLGGNCVL